MVVPLQFVLDPPDNTTYAEFKNGVIKLTSYDGVGKTDTVSACATISMVGSLCFDWHYETHDYSAWGDQFGYKLNGGGFTRLTTYLKKQNGKVCIEVDGTLTLCFEQQTSDGKYGSATATISNIRLMPKYVIPTTLSVIPSSVGTINVTFYDDKLLVSHCVDSLKVSGTIVYNLYFPRTSGCSWLPIDNLESTSFKLVSVYGSQISLDSFHTNQIVTNVIPGYRTKLEIKVPVKEQVDSCSVILEFIAPLSICSKYCSKSCIFSTVQII